MKTYFNDGLIGNAKMLATLEKNGKLARIFWPYIDSRQLLDEARLGIFIIEENKLIDVFSEECYISQAYIKDTNLLRTEIVIEEYEIRVILRDFVLMDQDVIIRRIAIENLSQKERTFDLLAMHSILGSKTNTPCCKFDFDYDFAVHYIQSYYMGIGFNDGIDDFRIGIDLMHEYMNNDLNGFDDIGMMPRMIIKKRLGKIASKNRKESIMYYTFARRINQLRKNVDKYRKHDYSYYHDRVVEHWHEFLKTTKQLSFKDKVIADVFTRTKLLFELVTDKTTGGILAAPELDEYYTKSGRYAYCWGRDAAFITEALDALSMHNHSARFYDFAMRTQEVNGSWEQRYYMDGNLAPSWGFQVDETGSIIFGLLRHYQHTKDIDYLKRHYKMVKKAANFLSHFIEKSVSLPRISFDLWEERRGIHAYSNAAVYAGLNAAIKIAKILKVEEKNTSLWEKTANTIKENTDKMFWKEDYKRFIRSIFVKKNPFGEEHTDQKVWLQIDNKGHQRDFTLEDWKFDISLLGLAVPFDMFHVHSEKMKSTFFYIEKTLMEPNSGCFKRYEDDFYMGGNPWVLTTLWASLYLSKLGEFDRAKEFLYRAIKPRTHNDFLPEQLDPETQKANWVIPLTWSHAMFVFTVLELYDKIEL